jgi:HD-GYP domain-containing protein (c-di-GMP phosphodiesterase class II)
VPQDLTDKNFFATPENFVATPLDSIPCEIPLPYALYLRIAGQFILFRIAGDTLSQRRVNSLAGQQVSVVYISRAELGLFMEFLEKAAERQMSTSADSAAVIVRQLLVAYVKQIEVKKSVQRELFLKLKALSAKMTEAIYNNLSLASTLVRRYSDPSVYHSNHCINVAVYSVGVARTLKMPLEEAKMLCLSAMVHNIGYVFVPSDILNKTQPLTPAEVEQIRLHPTQGAKLLKELMAPPEVVMVAKQHHERMDGEGYPNGLVGSEIHIFSRICSLADVYDALISHRPNSRPISPKAAVDKIHQMHGKFDPQILPMMVSKSETK